MCNYDVGECYCNDQFYGDSCGYVRCPQYAGKECNGEGECLRDTKVISEGGKVVDSQQGGKRPCHGLFVAFMPCHAMPCHAMLDVDLSLPVA